MNILGNSENYIGSTPGAIEVEPMPIFFPAYPDESIIWIDEEEQQRQALLAEAREQYDAWRAQKFEQLSTVAEMIKTATEEKEAVCQDTDKIPPVGTQAFRKRRLGRRKTYTDYTLSMIPDAAAAAFFRLAGAEGAVSQEDCRDADCLHPCFGPLHGRSCHQCYQTWVKTQGKGRSNLCDQCEIDFTEWHFPHIMTFEEKLISKDMGHLLDPVVP